MATFADNLKTLMKERRLTAKVICDATGIPASTLSEWMSGREPKLTDAIVRLAKFLGVSMEFLVTGEEPEQDIVADFLRDVDDGFAVIHKGVYRLKVEKFIGSKKKGGS